MAATKKTPSPVSASTKTATKIVKAAPKAALLAPNDAVRKSGNDYLTAASLILSQENLPAPVLAETFDMLKGYADAIDDVAGVARSKLLDMLKEKGSGESSLKLVVGDWELSARPRKTGLDAKKLESLLRAKGIDPTAYMTTKVTYEVDPTRTELLTRDNRLTQAELDTCVPPLEYNLMRPKKV